jgi:two-component system NtrC family response regulator/two-component system response regulator HydG
MKSMLIIDGSRTLAKLFAEIFEKRGWTVATCSDRECAMRGLAGNQLYDAIVLSDRVPGTSGEQLVRMIRALEHRRVIAVVMVTGSAEVREEALAAGADEVLVKPINPNALVWAVDKHVV